MKKFLTILSLGILTTSAAHAGFLVDPYLGYIVSGTTSATPAPTVSGNELGVRLGWDWMGFGAGLDATVSGTYSYAASGTTTSMTPMHYGLFASYKFPILFRAYATYFTNTKESQDSNNYITGTATKIGVQYTGLPFVAIGLEMYSGTGKDRTTAGVTSSFTGTESQTRLVISAPFSF
jgi:hypothetical protein